MCIYIYIYVYTYIYIYIQAPAPGGAPNRAAPKGHHRLPNGVG